MNDITTFFNMLRLMTFFGKILSKVVGLIGKILVMAYNFAEVYPRLLTRQYIGIGFAGGWVKYAARAWVFMVGHGLYINYLNTHQIPVGANKIGAILVVLFLLSYPIYRLRREINFRKRGTLAHSEFRGQFQSFGLEFPDTMLMRLLFCGVVEPAIFLIPGLLALQHGGELVGYFLILCSITYWIECVYILLHPLIVQQERAKQRQEEVDEELEEKMMQREGGGSPGDFNDAY